MDTEIRVLFVSADAADERVLNALLARDPDGVDVRVSAVGTAQAFFEAVYSEDRYQVIVLDERQSWIDRRGLLAACARYRADALVLLLVDGDAPDLAALAAESDIAGAYPRSSAGLVALTRLVTKIAAHNRSFSLRHDDVDAEADADVDTDGPGAREQQKLVYAVSHDLQDPLQLARRYADVLDEDYARELGEPGSKVLGHLRFNLNRTQEMLDELLDYSRLQNLSPDKQPVDFNDLLDEVIDLYRLTLQEVGGSVTRHQTLPTLLVDRRQFQRVLQNLIGNAIKFRSERPLHVTVRAQRVRNEWRIGVKDNGIGVAEEDTRRIFGMFERASGVDEYPGTGMGLAICKRIVQNHGGKIWVRSSPGNGSVFIFSVPQAEPVAEVVAA